MTFSLQVTPSSTVAACSPGFSQQFLATQQTFSNRPLSQFLRILSPCRDTGSSQISILHHGLPQICTSSDPGPTIWHRTMAYFRQGLLLRNGLLSQQIRLRTWPNTSFNLHCMCHDAHNLLCHCFRGTRIHEEPGTIQTQRDIYGA